MKNLKYLLIALLFAACQQQNNEEAIRKSIDNLHNQAMMINEKAVKTKFKLDSLLAKQRLQKNSDTARIQNAIAALNQADEKMMDWMHDFKLDFNGTNAAALQYFNGQLDSLKKVQQQLEDAIEQAKPLLNPQKN
jgi:hypothetical protein